MVVAMVNADCQLDWSRIAMESPESCSEKPN